MTQAATADEEDGAALRRVPLPRRHIVRRGTWEEIPAVRALLTAPLAAFLCESTWTACTAVNSACARRLRSRWGLRLVAASLPASPTASSRRHLWQRLCLGSLDFGGDGAGVDGYRELAARPCRVDAEIRRDINRTFPEVLEPRDTEALFRVLRAVSSRMEDVGYCQGMNFLAGIFVRVFGTAVEADEAAVYQCMLSVLLRHGMNQFFGERFPKLRLTVLQFDCLVEAFFPDLTDAFDAFNLSAEFYATQWFLTLFSYSLPFQYVLRIWDQFLCRGMKFIHRVGLALLKAARPMLLGQGFDETVRLLRSLGETLTMTPEALVEEALRFKVTNRLLCGLEQAMRSAGPRHGLPHCFPERDLNTGRTRWHVLSPMPASTAVGEAGVAPAEVAGDHQGFLEDLLPAPRIPMDPMQACSPVSPGVAAGVCCIPVGGAAEAAPPPRARRRGKLKAFQSAMIRSVKSHSGHLGPSSKSGGGSAPQGLVRSPSGAAVAQQAATAAAPAAQAPAAGVCSTSTNSVAPGSAGASVGHAAAGNGSSNLTGYSVSVTEPPARPSGFSAIGSAAARARSLPGPMARLAPGGRGAAGRSDGSKEGSVERPPLPIERAGGAPTVDVADGHAVADEVVAAAAAAAATAMAAPATKKSKGGGWAGALHFRSLRGRKSSRRTKSGEPHGSGSRGGGEVARSFEEDADEEELRPLSVAQQ